MLRGRENRGGSWGALKADLCFRNQTNISPSTRAGKLHTIVLIDSIRERSDMPALHTHRLPIASPKLYSVAPEVKAAVHLMKEARSLFCGKSDGIVDTLRPKRDLLSSGNEMHRSKCDP